MTLNVDSWIANALGKEARISHFDCKIFGGKTKTLKQQFKTKITDKYGERFLDDADYLIIFKGAILNKPSSIKKLFALTDRALGKNANSLTEGDFKVIKSTETSDHTSTQDVEDGIVDEPTTEETIEFIFVKVTLN